jgi:hypothetical protein
MNYAETTQVLAAIQIYDARHVDEATVKAWHKMLHEFTLPDCLAAVEAHFRESTDYLLPAHIIRRVKSMRSRRLALAEHPVLRYADEYDDDGKPLPDAQHKREHLRNLVANGQLTPQDYEQYRDGKITLDQLGNRTREITA